MTALLIMKYNNYLIWK